MSGFIPRALLFADSHLDQGAWPSRPEIAGDSQCAFALLVSMAIQWGVEQVIAAGDILDSDRPSPETAGFLAEQLKRLERARVAFFHIRGNHDCGGNEAGLPWPDAVSDWASHLDQKLITVDGASVYGLDWRPAGELDQWLSTVPECDLLVTHQAWEEWMGSLLPSEGSFRQIGGAKALFSGDYHHRRHERLSPSTGLSGQLKLAISPGSTNLRETGESDRKCALLWDGKDRWQELAIPCRPKVEVVAQSAEAMHQALDDFSELLAEALERSAGLPTAIKTPIVTAKFPAEPDMPVARLRRACQDVHLFLYPQRPQRKSAAGEPPQAGEPETPGLEGRLAAALPREDNRYAPALRLLSAPDAKREILKLRAERGVSA